MEEEYDERKEGNMSLIQEIPDSFWGLFRSCNREIYMEALLRINEEYEYSNYYLSREVCIRTLNEYFSQKSVGLMWDEYEGEADVLEPVATRILNWLIRTGWLRKVEDYNSLTTNIVIPDYAAVMIEAMEKLMTEEEDTTQLYIQNVYAILFSLKHDPRANVSLLDTALINTRKLNKALQDMLHNMDKFFGSLLEQRAYGELLRDHLEKYVEEVVRRKYHILKTSDNFYIYKADIKQWIGQMREDSEWMEELCSRSMRGSRGRSGRLNTAAAGPDDVSETENRDARTSEAASESLRLESEVLEKLDLIERGFDDIEHRISNMDKEHSKYVRATVSRLNYLLNEDDDMKGLVIQLLNRMAETQGAQREQLITAVGVRMNLSQVDILSSQSLYKRRRRKADFQEGLEPEEEQEELSREELLELNKLKKRFSREQIEEFVTSRMKDGVMQVAEDTVESEEDFEKLILAYDYSIRRKSMFQAVPVQTGKEQNAELCSTDGGRTEAAENAGQPEMVDNGRYRYPRLMFIRRGK